MLQKPLMHMSIALTKRKILNPYNVKDIILIDKYTSESFSFEIQKRTSPF